MGINPTKNPIVERKNFKKNLYKEIKEKHKLKDERDIVWMKFTKEKSKNGFLGVVATSNDINFQIPNNALEYNEKKNNNKWKFNTSGIIIHYLGKEWDENFVLIFPLQNIPSNITRSDIERGIGNFLIKKDVPILDFFSHRY